MENEKIEKFISEHPDWYVKDGYLVADFKFADFSVVQEKVNQMMKLAAAFNHHPNVTFGYKTIEVRTTTHEAGDVITEKDFAIAKTISDLVASK